MEKKTIALVEPCYYGVGLVESAYAREYDIIAIVSSAENPKTYGYEGKFKDLIIADIRSATSVSQTIDTYPHKDKFDAIIPGNDYVTPLTSEVAKYFGKKHISIEAEYTARYKDRQRIAYQKAGMPNAKFGKAKNIAEAQKLAEDIGYPIIVKPTHCACSQNVHKVDNDTRLKEIFAVLADFKTTYLDWNVHEEFLIEEYIEGPEFSVEIFMHNGEVLFASVTERIKTAPPFFVELGHVVPTSTYIDKSEELIDASRQAMLAIGLGDGPAHIEFRISGRGPIIMETNARPGGDHIAQNLLINAFGINFFDAYLDFYLDNPIKIEPTKNKASSIAYLVATQNGQVKSIKGVDELDKNPQIVSHNFTVKEGDIIRLPEDSNDRLGYVISLADTPAEAKKLAFDAINTIVIEYK